MHYEPRILHSRKLAGINTRMSMADNKTAMLWQQFMPRRAEISNAVGRDLYSVDVFDASFPEGKFSPMTEFEKWAATEVEDFSAVPDGMGTLVLDGLYLVFPYKGLGGPAAAPFYARIFTEWLPASGYKLDNRPHFALMGDKYRRDDPESEEEIWIPVVK